MKGDLEEVLKEAKVDINPFEFSDLINTKDKLCTFAKKNKFCDGHLQCNACVVKKVDDACEGLLFDYYKKHILIEK